jgi:hypothetical protein
MTNSRPSLNPADIDSLVGTLRFVVNKILQNSDGVLPAQVVAFEQSSTGARVQVQPLIMMVDTFGNKIPRAQIASVPVIQLGGGGYFMSFPLKAGDLGWIIASDRDISLFLQNYVQSAPNTYRMKNFADAVFIPAVMTGYNISEGDAESMVIQNLDGTIKISLSPTQVTITAPLTEVTGDLTVDGTINTTSINLGASGSPHPQTVGNLFVNGSIAATGTITQNVPP